MQKGQSKFSCVVFEKRSRCGFNKDTRSLSLTRFFFRATFLTVNKYCNNPCVCLRGGGGGEEEEKKRKKGITILGINVTIPSLEIAINQSLFKFTQKGSYITNTLVLPACPYPYLHNVKQTEEVIAQELCESRGGRPGLSVLTSLQVSVDVKIY